MREDRNSPTAGEGCRACWEEQRQRANMELRRLQSEGILAALDNQMGHRVACRGNGIGASCHSDRLFFLGRPARGRGRCISERLALETGGDQSLMRSRGSWPGAARHINAASVEIPSAIDNHSANPPKLAIASPNTYGATACANRAGIIRNPWRAP